MKDKQVRAQIATWWRIGSYKTEIEPLQVIAFTGSFVTYIDKSWGARERRESRNDIFPTFAEAKEEAVKRCEERVQSAKEELHRRQTALGMYKSMQEPSMMVRVGVL